MILTNKTSNKHKTKLVVLFYSLLLTILSNTYTFAANKFSISDGFGNPQNFSSTSAWSNTLNGMSCSCNPISKDQLKISQSMILDMTFAIGANTGSIDIYAGKFLAINYPTTQYNLSVPANTFIYIYGTLEVYDLTFSNGSIVYVGPNGHIIVHHNLTNNNNSDDVVIDGAINVTGTFFNGNGGGITGDGNITAGDFTGNGYTFGFVNTTIPDGNTVSTGSLPVEFISFTGIAEKNETVLTWQTLTEINNKVFEVERSENGYLFRKIGEASGSGTTNTPKLFSFNDKPDYSGIFYYRLKQVDYDGNFDYSPVIAIQYNHKGEFSIYPNPVEAGSEISIQGYEDEIFIVEIYDSNLKLVSENVSDGKLTIDRNMLTGNYIIIIRGDNNTHTSKIVIY
jgi:hypothetical protein